MAIFAVDTKLFQSENKGPFLTRRKLDQRSEQFCTLSISKDKSETKLSKESILVSFSYWCIQISRRIC